MGLEVLFAGIAAGGTFSATFAAVYGVSLTGLALRVGASLLLSAATNALFAPKVRQQDLRQRLAVLENLPEKRFVYGSAFTTGTPLPPAAKGGYLYACYILNSRPSEGNFELYIDNRLVQLDGDPFDFTGPGATATNDLFVNHLNCWFQLGDQTTPPDAFVNEAGYDANDFPFGYKPTDAGQGTTLVWLKLKRGSNTDFNRRWRNWPRPLVTVSGDWSKVWDLRNPSQVAEDPTTHEFSRNQALCLIDLVMRNPFRPYALENLALASWRDAANIADEVVALKSGGSEPRYQVSGTLVFDGSEIEQITRPLLEAGAARLVRTGGQLGIVPGVAKNVALTIDDMIGLPGITVTPAPEEVFDEVRVDYYPLERDGEPASLKPWNIPGVVGAGLPRVLSLNLTMVSSATQAQRLRKIFGLRTTYNRKLAGVSWPDAFVLVGGSWVNTSLPYAQMNGTFEVEQIQPLADPAGENGLALRMPITLRETSEAIYVWDGLTEEEDVIHQPFIVDDEAVQPGGPISIETGDTVNGSTGQAVIPRVKFLFDPSTSSNVERYEWQVAVQGEPYTSFLQIDGDVRDGAGKVFAFFDGQAGVAYDLQVRALTPTGASDWVEFTGATPVVNISLDTPSIVSTTPAVGEITVTVLAPNDTDVREIEIFESDTDDSGAANLFADAAISRNEQFTATLTGLGNGPTTKFFFARVRGEFASVSAFSASAQDTSL